MSRYLMLFSLVIFSIPIFAQHITISGTLKDEETGEALIGASVYDPITLTGTTTNPYGFFSISLPNSIRNLHISYVGYAAVTIPLSGEKDTIINLEIKPSIELEEVQVLSNSPQQKVQMTQMSSVTMNPKQIKNIPVLLGETDVIKSLQLMPGVQGGTEGSSGMYVRGGGPDQNLILLDGVPVYNINHLFGFMSVFNADAIRNVTLIKGGFPARYGGRLSSVLDIRMKEGNMKEFHGEGSIGIISTNLTFEGPIKKDKTSFMVSGRRSYIDILSYPIQLLANQSSGMGKSYAGYFLQDFNVKINHIVNDKNRIYLSFYTGKDKFYLKDKSGEDMKPSEYKDEVGLQWGNFTSSLRWNSVLGPKLFMNATLLGSNYTFKITEDYSYKDVYSTENGTETSSSNSYWKYYSQIRDYSAKVDLDYFPLSKHQIKFGASITRHGFSPGVTIAKENGSTASENFDTLVGKRDIPSIETFAYLEDEISITNRLKTNIGVHISNFNVESTNYFSVEPRISARLMLLDNLSLKAAYVYMSQNLHLLSNSSLGLPTDLWVPSTKKIKPQKATQASLGLSYALGKAYEISVEGYYKEMKQLMTYKDGASFIDLNNGDWEDMMTFGEGKAYGIELFSQKVIGKFTGFVGYTLSKSVRKFPEVSNGVAFPDNFDSRHDFTITGSYKFNERIKLGATWIYRTGYPITLEDEAYNSNISYGQQEGSTIIRTFENRNNYRLPNYHRLDLSVQFSKEKKKLFSHMGPFGVYNAYARKNPLFIYPVTESVNGVQATKLKQISIFSIMPFIRWSFKF